jgi:hypothetical protein
VPEEFHSLGTAFKKIFKESGGVQGGRIRVSFPILTELGDPILWLAGIENLELAGRVQIWSAGVVQDAKFTGFDSDDHVRLPGRQVLTSRTLPLELDDHH